MKIPIKKYYKFSEMELISGLHYLLNLKGFKYHRLPLDRIQLGYFLYTKDSSTEIRKFSVKQYKLIIQKKSEDLSHYDLYDYLIELPDTKITGRLINSCKSLLIHYHLL